MNAMNIVQMWLLSIFGDTSNVSNPNEITNPTIPDNRPQMGTRITTEAGTPIITEGGAYIIVE